MQWKKKGHEFDSVAPSICDNQYKYVIWGAGTFGQAFYEDFCNEINIVAFVDSKKEKQNKTIQECPVFSPDFLKQIDGKIVLVSTGWTNDVFAQLDNMGYTRWSNYFHIDEFITIYRMYKQNRLCVSNLNVNITEFCSLKCKECSALNPYIKDKKNYTKEEIKYSLDLYFKVIDSVSILGIVGGDAMVHPQFEEILEMIGSHYYKTRVNNIEIYSNAIIVPSHKCLDLMKKYNIVYRFTDYGNNTLGKQKSVEIINILKDNNIRYDYAKFEKWSSCGYPQESNGLNSPKEWRMLYKMCDRRSCQGILGTRLFYCGMAIGAERAGYCAAHKADYFELNQDNIDKKELMEFVLGYNKRGYIEYCKKCNGGPNINTNYVEPGIQIV